MIAALDKALLDDNISAVEELWLQLTLNAKQAEFMKKSLLKNLDKQKLQLQEISELQEKLARLYSEADESKQSSRTLSSNIDEEFANCHSIVSQLRKEREEIQSDYTTKAAEISVQLDSAMTRRANLDTEKQNSIANIQKLINTISANEKSNEKQLQQYKGIEQKMMNLENLMTITDEGHEMAKADFKAKELLLTEQENELKIELKKYAGIFEEVFANLSMNKEISSKLQAQIDEISGHVKVLIKNRDALKKKCANIQNNISTANETIAEREKAIAKAKDQIARYDALIDVFEQQILDLENKEAQV